MARGRPTKRQVILDTARELFAETGYQGTSIDLVVKQAGVSKPTVYNNFPTKQALLLALMESLSEEAQAFQEDLWSKPKLTAAEGIIKAFEHIADSPAFLAVYRICYGESHKLESTTYQLFKAFDASLVNGYREWLKALGIAVADSDLLAIVAICREGILIPALSGTPRLANDLILKSMQLHLPEAQI